MSILKKATAAALCAIAALSLANAGDAPAEIKTASGIAMVKLPAGSFQMGDAKGSDDAKAVHKVSLDAFYMDKYEVTQEAFEGLLGINPSKSMNPKCPVEQLRWQQAAKYCNARSKKEGLKECYNKKTWKCDFTANGYRLPTEAEWEYACRAGTSSAYYFGEDAGKLAENAWVKSNSSDATHPGGGKGANAWGLCDMSGNVMEWCNDFYAADYYGKSVEKNPAGPNEGKQRILRGGGFRSKPDACASGARFKDDPATPDICAGNPDYGFRCVRKAE